MFMCIYIYIYRLCPGHYTLMSTLLAWGWWSFVCLVSGRRCRCRPCHRTAAECHLSGGGPGRIPLEDVASLVRMTRISKFRESPSTTLSEIVPRNENPWGKENEKPLLLLLFRVPSMPQARHLSSLSWHLSSSSSSWHLASSLVCLSWIRALKGSTIWSSRNSRLRLS